MTVLALCGACAPAGKDSPPPPVGTGGLSAGQGPPAGGADTGTGDTGTASNTTGGGSTATNTSTGGSLTPYGACPGGQCPRDEICVQDGTLPGAQICGRTCLVDADCPPPSSGTAVPRCAPPDLGGDTVCRLDCQMGEVCPDGAVCTGLWCAHP